MWREEKKVRKIVTGVKRISYIGSLGFAFETDRISKVRKVVRCGVPAVKKKGTSYKDISGPDSILNLVGATSNGRYVPRKGLTTLGTVPNRYLRGTCKSRGYLTANVLQEPHSMPYGLFVMLNIWIDRKSVV